MYNLLDFVTFLKKFVLGTNKYQLYDVYHSNVQVFSKTDFEITHVTN